MPAGERWQIECGAGGDDDRSRFPRAILTQETHVGLGGALPGGVKLRKGYAVKVVERPDHVAGGWMCGVLA